MLAGTWNPLAFACLLFVVLVARPPSALALTDSEVTRSLEALGEYEAAWPLTLTEAQRANDYQTWRALYQNRGYRAFDTDHQAYRGAWEQAHARNAEPVYRDFMTLDPASPQNAVALRAIFLLRRELDTIEGYRDFMADFPGSVESVEALLRIHEIAFARARAADDPAVYDAYVRAFPAARQVPEAIELAFHAERRACEQDLRTGPGGLSLPSVTDDKRDRTARRLFNDARRAEQTGDTPVAARKQRLLALDLFRDTPAYTEQLDRAERLDWQAAQQGHQQRVEAAFGTLATAVTGAIDAQTRHLDAGVQAQTQRLESAIADHNRMMDERLQSVSGALDSGLREAGTRIAQVQQASDQRLAEVYGNLNAGLARIGSAVGDQTQAIDRAAADARWENERLFGKAQEQASRQGYLARRCNEELARKGRYGVFSPCK